MYKIVIVCIVGFITVSCSDDKLEKKGFSLKETSTDGSIESIKESDTDSFVFETRPRNVLFTAYREHRLTPVYKVNYNKKNGQTFIGSNEFLERYWREAEKAGNNWNNNFMPGYAAMQGYNLVNVSHYNNQSQSEHKLFDKPVLIKTLYYPADSKDTLNFKPIIRKNYMVTVYDEDSNKDGAINTKDLRRFYLFDTEGGNKKPLIPLNYSVMSSEYDAENDFMYIFAKIDQNKNGQMEENEETHIFWIDLNNPENVGVHYKPE